MSCIPLIPTFSVPNVQDDYYEELLFNQVLKDKVISDDSFDKLYFISKNFKITGISDTKGTCSFIVDRQVNKVMLSDEKKKQLKIDFENNQMITSAHILVDYE